MLDFLKNYYVFLLVLMIVSYLVPKEAYKTYIQFFIGIFVVVLFLKPLLDNMGIEVDEQTLETVFLQEQQAFLDAHGIKDTKDLKAKLQEGAAFYPALEGIKGATGDLITDRLAAEDFSLDMMTEQVAKNARVPEKAKETVDLDQVQEVAETLTKSVADKTTLDIRTSETPGKDDKAVEEQGE